MTKYRPPLEIEYFGDMELVRFRTNMRQWDKKLERLDPEMLVYIVMRANQLLEQITEEL